MSNLLFVHESFRRHMDNGRWLFQRGMEQQGWVSVGRGCPSPEVDSVDVRWAVERFRPKMVLFWPRYEWDRKEWGPQEPGPAPEDKFVNWEFLLDRPDILRVAVFHDAGSAARSQRRWHEEFQPDVYLTWYHAKAVLGCATWVPVEKMLRTFHILDSDNILEVRRRHGVCALSGAGGPPVYPLRAKAREWARAGRLGPGVDVLSHPGYHWAGTRSNDFVRRLSNYRVALCTSSSYKFALRKIFEATAAGCRVVTDLPAYDYLPEIDDNLIRLPPIVEPDELCQIIHDAAVTWDVQRQRYLAGMARLTYGWRYEAKKISDALTERMN